MTAPTDGRPPLQRWIVRATDVLAAGGVESARHDAERIAAHILGLSWSEMWARAADVELDPETTGRLDDAIRRRVGGEPLAYIEGTRVFYGLEFECGPGVLVPRPETEVLVDVALELLDGSSSPTVVDLGTGSGAIGIAIAMQRPDATVVATDVSEEALVYARRNAERLGAGVRMEAGDLYGALPEQLRGRTDLIVSNPPYVPDGAGLPRDVAAEPPVAIFGGEIGNDLLQRVVDGAGEWLVDGGALVLEIGEAYQRDVLPGASMRDDHTGRPRVIWRRF